MRLGSVSHISKLLWGERVRREMCLRAIVLIVPKGKPSKSSPTSSMVADLAQNRIAMKPVTKTKAICTRTKSFGVVSVFNCNIYICTDAEPTPESIDQNPVGEDPYNETNILNKCYSAFSMAHCSHRGRDAEHSLVLDLTQSGLPWCRDLVGPIPSVETESLLERRQSEE